MRKKFSEKFGFKNPRDTFQMYQIDDALRNRIWNQIQIHYFDKIKLNLVYPYNIYYKSDVNFFERIYDEFFKSHEKINISMSKLNSNIKKQYFIFEWYEIYDFIEYIAEVYHDNSINILFRENINIVLENEMSGYRFIDSYIAPIIDSTEIEEIEDAINSEYIGAKIHLSNALEHLSDRENPDYINSIKESISAVESVLNKISETTNVALNRAINNIPFEIDSNFKGAIVKMYSWTSSADGIRHGVTGDEIKSKFAEAKYMLVTCSAFINYLIEKKENEG